MQIKQTYTQDHRETPLISFIVTYHNEPEDLLRECVESILSLTLDRSERELIVVDDGSDYPPLSMLLELCPDVIYIRQSNHGPSSARNRGISISSGKYIQFVDADDCLIRAPYEHCLDIVRYKDPDIVLFDFTSHKNKAENDFTAKGPIGGSQYMLHNNIHASACSYIFLRKSLVNLRFPGKITYGEDEEFTSQLIMRCERLYATEAKAYFYRQQRNSLTHKRDPKSRLRRLSDNFDVICHISDIAERLPKAERDALRRRVAQLSMDYIYNVITMTHSRKQLSKAVDKLMEKGLFPLPKKNYTRRYNFFRMMVNSKLGRELLLVFLRGKK